MGNTLGIRGFDYVEFYVGSGKMAAYWHAKALGMKLEAYAGPETGIKDRVSYYLTSKNFKCVITAAVKPENYETAGWVYRHGDGVKRYAMRVTDVDQAYQYAVTHGGIPCKEPYKLKDDDGVVTEAVLRLYDDTELVFVNYDEYEGIFRPGYKKPHFDWEMEAHDTGLIAIDHIVGNVRVNEMNRWADYMNHTLDFETFLYFGPGDISTRFSSLLSKVVRTKDAVIKNPINEPYAGVRKSQIQEYIDEFRGTGVQHLAIVTNDIVKTVDNMRRNGVQFLNIPENYYENLKSKISENDIDFQENMDDIQECGILCDVEGDGYLLQLFTKPAFDRPTFFYEIIQRRGAQGFGQGNFQALFESIEQEQALRGNL